MTRTDRESDPGESFDGGYHLYAKEKHKEILNGLTTQSSNLS